MKSSLKRKYSNLYDYIILIQSEVINSIVKHRQAAPVSRITFGLFYWWCFVVPLSQWHFLLCFPFRHNSSKFFLFRLINLSTSNGAKCLMSKTFLLLLTSSNSSQFNLSKAQKSKSVPKATTTLLFSFDRLRRAQRPEITVFLSSVKSHQLSLVVLLIPAGRNSMGFSVVPLLVLCVFTSGAHWMGAIMVDVTQKNIYNELKLLSNPSFFRFQSKWHIIRKGFGHHPLLDVG